MKKYFLFLPLILLGFLTSCSKEVKIDIPGYVEQLVVDGSIQTDQPPIILLSNSQDIYAPTNFEAYLNSFVSGATVTISDGTNTVVLDEICTDNLPPGTESFAAAVFGIPVDQLVTLHLCAYTTFNTAMWGQVGKTYTLTITNDGKTYTSTTTIPQPTALNSMVWHPAGGFLDYGYLTGQLSDPVNQVDSYKWEIKRINDPIYSKPFNPFFNDQFFNGLTFDFETQNPIEDPTIPSQYRGYFHLGDTLILKMSKLGRKEYSFFDKKFNQIYSAGSPFATPLNVPTNITGGAMGVWVGYSPWYDTIICQ